MPVVVVAVVVAVVVVGVVVVWVCVTVVVDAGPGTIAVFVVETVGAVAVVVTVAVFDVAVVVEVSAAVAVFASVVVLAVVADCDRDLVVWLSDVAVFSAVDDVVEVELAFVVLGTLAVLLTVWVRLFVKLPAAPEPQAETRTASRPVRASAERIGVSGPRLIARG